MNATMIQRYLNFVRLGVLLAALVPFLGYYAAITPLRAFSVELPTPEAGRSIMAPGSYDPMTFEERSMNCRGPSEWERSQARQREIIPVMMLGALSFVAVWIIRYQRRLNGALRIAGSRLDRIASSEKKEFRVSR